MDNVEEIMEMAKTLRDAADNADRLAAVLRTKDRTEKELKEIEDATKDFIWQIVKLQILCEKGI